MPALRLAPRSFQAIVVALVTGVALQAPLDASAQLLTLSPTQPLVTLGSEAEERLRVDQLLGRAELDGFLLRTAGQLSGTFDAAADSGDAAASVAPLAPEWRVVHNSDLPFGLNDGLLWAGRGWNSRLTAGLRVEVSRVSLVLAPEFAYAQNRPFQVIMYPRDGNPARDPFAHPFHPPPESIDWPLRFGSEAVRSWGPGQSSLTVDLGPVAAGAATENVWWGPGIRNAILLSDNAPGFPHLFVRTAGPLDTRAGAVEGHALLGRLDESKHFDDDPSNDRRSLSALALTLRPAFEPDLILGVARVVFAPLDRDATGLAAALDVFRNVGRPNAEDDGLDPGHDQIFALFGRWVLPGTGFEAYAEWARFEQPASVRDLLEFPQHSQGYTLGLQWARPLEEGGGIVRVQAEHTYLEPTTTFRHRRVFSTYASRAVPQGYTHRGQVLGAAIGPGGSGHWAAGDYFADRWRAGVFLGRIRWDNAALFTDVVRGQKREDVSLFWGLRATVDVWELRATAGLQTGVRMDYLFQSYRARPPTYQREGVDVANRTLSFTLTTPVGG